MKHSYSSLDGNDVWIKEDKPLEQRILTTLVFGTKREICQAGGFAKSAVWADVGEQTGELWVGDEKVLTASIPDKQLSISFAEGWEGWFMDESHPQFKKLVDSLREKLTSTAKALPKEPAKAKRAVSPSPNRGASSALANKFHQLHARYNRHFRRVADRFRIQVVSFIVVPS